MYLQRKMYPALHAHLASREVTVLTGMRRTGKTTLVRQLFSSIPSENKLYLDCENVVDRELFSHKNYDNIPLVLKARGFDTTTRLYLFLDEIQLVPHVPSVIKYLHDHYDIKCIVTGSSSYYLKHLFSESLAGRKKIFELYPLDFGEFLSFKGVAHVPQDFSTINFLSPEYERLRTYYEAFIRFGGFPQVVLAQSDVEKKDLLQDIVSSYLNIDIATLSDFRRKDVVYSLMKMLATRAGSRLDYAKLARHVGISPVTVQNYVDFFEQTYMLSRVSVFTRSPDRAIVKAKKLYFCDTGILNTLGEVSSGVQFENAVFTQLRHHGAVTYYALKNGREVDFILDGTLALETKETPSEIDFHNVSALAEMIGVQNARLVGRHEAPSWRCYTWGGDIR